MTFHETDIHTLSFNPFDKISKQWMLITAGDRNGSNTMTASWGGVGIMWGKPVATAYYPAPEVYKRICRRQRVFHPFLPAGRTEESIKYLWFRVRKRCGRQMERSRAASLLSE